MSYQRAVRWPWLVFIMAAHIAFIVVCLKAIGRHERAASSTALPAIPALLIELILPTAAPPAKSLATAAPAIVPQKKPAPASPVSAERPSIQPEKPAVVIPAESATATTTPTIDTVHALDLDTRRISKDLWSQQRALPFAPKPALPPIATLAEKMAAAAVPGEVTYKTFTTADGTRITKVTSGRGSYCVIAPNPAGGATIIRREASSNRVVSCGNY